MLKKFIKVYFLFLFCLVTLTSAYASSYRSTIEEVNSEYSYRYGEVQGYASTVDYWYVELEQE